jgi:hypothetical protein
MGAMSPKDQGPDALANLFRVCIIPQCHTKETKYFLRLNVPGMFHDWKSISTEFITCKNPSPNNDPVAICLPWASLGILKLCKFVWKVFRLVFTMISGNLNGIRGKLGGIGNEALKKQYLSLNRCYFTQNIFVLQ